MEGHLHKLAAIMAKGLASPIKSCGSRALGKGRSHLGYPLKRFPSSLNSMTGKGVPLICSRKRQRDQCTWLLPHKLGKGNWELSQKRE